MKNVIIITSVILLLVSCKQPVQVKQNESTSLLVQTERVIELEHRIPVRASGLLSTATLMKLSFKTSGIIQDISAREGVTVRKGQELARLDLAEIQAMVTQAKISYEKAKRDLDRAGNLYRDSVVTLEQYQDARSGFELSSAQKQVADFNLQHSVIKAPSNGKVQKVLVENNELIAAGYPAILFASTESEWVVRGTVTDKDIVKLSLGDTALVYMDAFPNKVFHGEIAELASFADPVSGTYEVEVMLPNGHAQFRTGFIARMDIQPAGILSSVVVPVEALQNTSDHSANIFIYNEGKALKRKVRIGRVVGDKVVVQDGVLPGEEVITAGAPYLRDGDVVHKKDSKQ